MKVFAAILMLGIAMVNVGTASAFPASIACESGDFAMRFMCEAARNGS